jgi:hypothetical protein
VGDILESYKRNSAEGIKSCRGVYEAAQFYYQSIAIPDIFEEDNEQHRDAPDRSVHFQDDVDTEDIMHRRRRDLES